MSRVRYFFTSDTHFGHGNIIKYCNRPFLSAADQEALEANGGTWHTDSWKGRGSSSWRMTPEAIRMMDDTLVNNINKIVGDNDVLYHLGDFAMAGKYGAYEKCRQYRDRIHCRNIHFVWGNHDERSIRNLFSSTHDLFEVNVNGQKIVLCHYAMAVWHRSHHGAWHLYGHSHAGAEPWLDQSMPNRRSIDVGVDNAYKILGEFRPFSFEELQEIMSKRLGCSIDHHVPKEKPQSVSLSPYEALEKCRQWALTDEEVNKLMQ